MKFWKKLVLVVTGLVFIAGNNGTALAATEGDTLLPGTEADMTACTYVMLYVNNASSEAREIVTKRETVDLASSTAVPNTITIGEASYTDILACALKTGGVKMWMVPFIIRYILEFVIGIAGLLAVGFVVYGGFLYLFSGISENKDAGKTAIRNGLLGMVITLVAWGVVSIVVKLLTSF